MTHTLKPKHSQTSSISSYYQQELLHMDEARSIAQLLYKNRVPYVFLKGAPLYKNLNFNPHRILADIDILIDSQSSERVERLFHKLGYVREKNSPKDAPAHLYRKKRGRFMIDLDLHTEPVFLMSRGNDFSFYPKQLRTQLTTVFLAKRRKSKINAIPYYFLSPLHQSLYLCLHFYHHSCQNTDRLSFLIYVLNRARSKDKIFWKNLADLSHHYRLDNFITPVLKRIVMYSTLAIPDTIMREITTPLGSLVYDLGLFGNLFNEDNRRVAGIRRFVLMTILSPEPGIKKITGLFRGGRDRIMFFVRKESRSYVS